MSVFLSISILLFTSKYLKRIVCSMYTSHPINAVQFYNPATLCLTILLKLSMSRSAATNNSSLSSSGRGSIQCTALDINHHSVSFEARSFCRFHHITLAWLFLLRHSLAVPFQSLSWFLINCGTFRNWNGSTLRLVLSYLFSFPRGCCPFSLL